MRFHAAILFCFALGGGCVEPSLTLTLGSTTSILDSGLLDILLPAFERETGVSVRVVARGTGEVLEMAKRGDVDVLLTHSPGRERALVDDGKALSRHPVMFNRFVIAGVGSDTAQVVQASSAEDAFQRIHDTRSLFMSRGDKSGTHEKELTLWSLAGLEPTTFGREWYKETGTGQGATLLAASELDGYLLVDEATLLQFHAQGRAKNIVPIHSSGEILRNQYSVTLLDPARAPVRHAKEAAEFAAWLSGPSGQSVIAGYQIQGNSVFSPNAGDTEA